jgi:hypothetical protein
MAASITSKEATTKPEIMKIKKFPMRRNQPASFFVDQTFLFLRPALRDQIRLDCFMSSRFSLRYGNLRANDYVAQNPFG